ncbi:MAG: four helix bundle protein [Planctomycetes bacterium]|jgi:four helix bundle protein|nr:four helix bundle protein [Planctomycetota bacterium]
MGLARDFRELQVYQKSFDCACEIARMTRSFPVEERYALSDQARRASRSVRANIAEAWRKRRYPKSFVSKLSDADAEAAECTVWLDLPSTQGFAARLVTRGSWRSTTM